MAATRIIKDPETGQGARVYPEGTIGIVQHPHPPIGETIPPLPFSQFFTDNGKDTGSEDMRVDGSSTPIEFCISANGEYDIYIKSITVQISDNGASLDKFAAITALTNGIKFYYQNIKIGELVITESIKTNLDFFRISTAGKDFGATTNSWRADISGGGKDTYFPEIDLHTRFGLIWGLRLVAGTTDKLVFRVQDDLSTGIEDFNIKAYGIRINA